jgi:hypothetical protein
MRRVSLMNILTSVERTVTNASAAVLRGSMTVLTRLTGRGKHREWRKEAEAELERKQRNLRP